MLCVISVEYYQEYLHEFSDTQKASRTSMTAVSIHVVLLAFPDLSLFALIFVLGARPFRSTAATRSHTMGPKSAPAAAITTEPSPVRTSIIARPEPSF